MRRRTSGGLVSRRGEAVSPFLAMEVTEEAERMQKAGADVVSLALGEPDFDTPECIKQAAYRALRDGATHYTHSLGLLDLREAICEHYLTRYRVSIQPDQVLVTSGTSPALFMIFAALLDPGDEVILSNPHYSCYPNFVRFSAGRLVFVEASPEDGFEMRPEALRSSLSTRTKAILINSPGNPTGAVLSSENMASIAELGPHVVSDEIYHGLVYEGRERSILEFTSNACVLNGFSKLYAMTGWRLGYVIGPRPLIRAIQKMQQSFLISANAFVQKAGLAALREAGADVRRMVEIYAQRRQFLLARLQELGFILPCRPTGAFYVLVDVRHYTRDSMALSLDILQKAHVAVTPGIDFGSRIEGYLRLSYAASIESIAEGLDRLADYFRQASQLDPAAQLRLPSESCESA